MKGKPKQTYEKKIERRPKNIIKMSQLQDNEKRTGQRNA